MHPAAFVAAGVREPGVSTMLQKKTNPHLVDTILKLRRVSRENDAPVWRSIAERLERPSRVWDVVNTGDLQRVGEDDRLHIVAGKVLASGYLDRGLTVAAWSFSDGARDKIEAAGGTCLRLDKACETYADGANVKVVA